MRKSSYVVFELTVAFHLPALPAPAALGAHNRIPFTSAAYLKTQSEVPCPALCITLHFFEQVQASADKSNEPSVTQCTENDL